MKFLAAIAVVATAACSTDPTSPGNSSPTLSSERDGGTTSSSGSSIIVTESDVSRQLEGTLPLRSWVFYYRNPTTSTGVFVSGPGHPPLGVGSFELGTVLPTDKGTLFNYDHVGTRLADISRLGYSTWRDPASTAPAVQLPSMNIEIDYNGPNVAGGYSSLVFEPVYNPDQGAIQSGVWQTWNGIPGIWWSTHEINGVCATTCYVPWSTIVANNPDATILGGFGVNQGSGTGGLVAAADALIIGTNGNTWTYNFEPFRTPTTKDDCKDGGWQNVRAADGSAFKNQGQCVSYANHDDGNGND
ncbi:MAG: hypothetical protein ABI408_06990 [Gemmatimonadaceae bacterium]